VLAHLAAALKPGGIFYLSFKDGNTERTKNDRWFNNYDEPSLRYLLGKFQLLKVVSLWQTPDARPGRSDEIWLNALVLSGV